MEGDKPKDLKEKAYDYSVKVIKFIEKLEVKDSNNFLVEELIKSSTFIGASLLEGVSPKSNKDLLTNYQVALKFANQSKYWLGLLKDGVGADKFAIKKLLSEAEEISKSIKTTITKIEKD